MNRTVHFYAPADGAEGAERLDRIARSVMPDCEPVCWYKQDDFIEGVKDVEYLLADNPPKGFWRSAAKLKLLHHFGAGVDNFLPAHDLPDTVAVANVRGLASEPVSDFALTLILILTKGLHRAFSNQRLQQWCYYTPDEISTKTLGIAGVGTIGLALARKARSLGYRTIGLNRTAKPRPELEEAYGIEGADAFLERSDIITILMPKTPDTVGFLDRRRLGCLKEGALLVNLGRGGLVDEAALVEKLRDGSLAGAAFDVFEDEPLAQESPLWTAPNLLITPHVAGAFPGVMEKIVTLFRDNIKRLDAGKALLTPVDLKRGY